MGLANETPHRDESDARSELKNPRTIPNHSHFFTFSLRICHSWRFGAGNTYLPTGIGTAAVPTVHSCPNKLYNIHGDTHTTIKVTVQSQHEPSSRRMAIRSIGVHYVSYKLHYVPSSTVRTKRSVREAEQSEKLPFGYKRRRISHSSPHFLITMNLK